MIIDWFVSNSTNDWDEKSQIIAGIIWVLLSHPEKEEVGEE